jgi:hypothetical protein
MSLASPSPNTTLVEGELVVPSTNKSKKSKKKSEAVETVDPFPCSMCEKKFPTDAARIQHEKDKHKVGTLVEVFPSTSTDDLNGDRQPHCHDNESHIDLIVFTPDVDCGPLQLNSLMTTSGTGTLIDFSDDDSNSSGPISELNDNGQLQTNFLDNEEPTKIDIAKHEEEDD